MNYKYAILGFVLLVIAVACNKDKFTSAPQVKIKSISPSEVNRTNLIQLKASFTDDEGDIDSALIVYKWFNGDVVTRKDTLRDYLISNLGLPEGTRSGDMVVNFLYGVFGDYPLLPASPVARDTTAAIGIILIDKKNQRSAYAESDKIRLKKP